MGTDESSGEGPQPGEIYQEKGTSERLIDAVADAWWIWRIALAGAAIGLVDAVIL